MSRLRWPTLGVPGTLLLALSVLAAPPAPASAAPGPKAPARAASVPAADASAARTPAESTGPAADVLVNGWGDSAGYHLAVGTGAGGYTWRELAVMRPGGIDDASWTGYQCVSGDGRHAAVAILPASAVNRAEARDHGAFAYTVDLRSGAVKPVATGVALKYHSPGCGLTGEATFVVNPGENQRSTQVLSVDLPTGRIRSTATVQGQVTSVVPTSEGPVGVMGDALVRIPSPPAGSAAPKVLARVDGDAYDLRPTAEGTVDFAVRPERSEPSRLMRLRSGKLSTLGRGPKESLRLMQGRSGHAIAVGASEVAPGSGITRAQAKGLPNGVTAVSLDGGALIGDGAKTASSAPLVLATRTGGLLNRPAAKSTRSAVTALPAPVAKPVAAPSAGATSLSAAPASGSVLPQAKTSPSVSALAAAGQTTPKCAVDRLAENRQVLQPGTEQVSWAIQMAEQGLLTGSAYTRPAGYANLGLAAYAPNSDFGRVVLKHPANDTFDSVPRSLYQAIVAQESNFSQASWHALPGIAGGALVGDYYGAGGSISHMDYAKGDCGYGLGQVTTGMSKGDTTYSVNGQTKIAVDYQENVSAGLQILERTWNQLYDAGITVNGGNPRYLENWYLAAWAYNSGVQPTAAFGNTTGCVPSPTCVGADGTWGLGWANNPANPDYPPTRAPYLRSSYADASHPASWPYQERIMGWMGQPILRFNQPAYAKPDYHGGKTWLQIPPVGSFCTADNKCDPTGAQSPKNCTLASLQCWWHSPVTFISDCATTCATSAYTAAAGSAEPAMVKPHPHPPTCTLDTSKVPNAGYGSPIIVDESQSQPPLNRVGCGASNWSQGGTFTYSYGTNGAGDPIGALDTHQLGAGFGGHVLFTHTEDGSNPDLINTGTWTPNLPKLQYYKIKLHFPSTAASATNVVYTINPGGGVSPWKIRVNQDWGSEEWVTIGTFAMQNGGNVKLTNQSEITGSGNINYADYDVAYDAVAFIPMGGTPGQPIGGPPGIKDAPKGSNPAWTQCGCVRRTAGDPVDTSTGYFGETITDLSTPGRGAALNFSRTYASALSSPAGPNAALAVNGAFGWGWTHSYNLSAATDGTSGDVTIRQEDGSQVTFVNSSGTYAPSAPRYNASLTKSGTSYTFTRKSKEVFTFDTATGRLLSATDLAGSKASPPYATTMAYNGSGQLSTITDPGGRVYTLTWTGSHITGLSDSAGRKVTYGYDAGGNLTDVYGAGTTRAPTLKDDDHATFGYDASHLMTSMRSAAQFGSTATPAPVTTNVYDASERVTKQTDPLGAVTVFEYGPDAAAGLTAGQTRVTDPAGHKTLYTYQSGMLTSETRGFGTADAGTWTYTYDPISMGMTSASDPKGNLQTFAYDDHGNQISASDARGFTTSQAYDATDRLITKIDPTGLQTTYGYDEAGHITASGSGFGLLTSVTQQPVSGTAAARQVSIYYEDAAHPADATRTVNARGNTSTNTFDAAGNITSATDAEGNKTLYGYDAERGLMTSMVSPAGVAAGTVPGCTPPAKGCTTFAYDVRDHHTRTVDPLGRSVSATFDANGNMTSSTDANNRKTVNGFDAFDQKTSVTLPDNSRLTTVYNGDGTVARTVDAANAATVYGYDGQGRQTTRKDPDNRVTTVAYDTAGNMLTSTDPQNRVTTYTYDPAGKPITVTYSDGTTPNVTISYDPAGRQTAMTDGTGTTTRSYNAFGQLASQTNGAGATTTFGYDANGNETSVVYPGGTGRTVTRTFDKADRLTGLLDWNAKSTTFGYDADSHWNSTTFPNGTVSTTGFNDAGQRMTDTLRKGTATLASLTYTRDPAGQLSGETSTGVPGGAQTFGYTPRDQLEAATAGSVTTGFGYDAAGNPTKVGTTHQVFDAAGQLCWSTTGTAPVDPVCGTPASGATTYTFDPQGNRTKATTGAGAVSSYTYDQAGRLTKAEVGGTTSTYAYDGNGLRASKTVGSTTTAFSWDADQDANLLYDGATSYLYGPGGTPVEQITAAGSQWYFHDQLGSTRALTDAAGAVAGTYGYTPYGTVSAHTGASSPLQFSGQYADAETGLTYLRARYYDPATAQFLTVDPEVRSTLSAYGYVDNNPLNHADPSGRFFGALLGGVAAVLAAPEALVVFVVAVVVVVAVIAVAYAISEGINSWRDSQSYGTTYDSTSDDTTSWDTSSSVAQSKGGKQSSGKTLTAAEQEALDRAAKGLPCLDPKVLKAAKQKQKFNEKLSGDRNAQKRRSN
ncbi:RHS repeat-associated core domain-containing protein [Streptomyces sp. NPDC096079]|uniref:RHS repeat-associated core domain-containing protein n=1 Tax=Streptomyces sp. NPDC096079 TaxID=3155820 RepID=UPI00331A31E0